MGIDARLVSGLILIALVGCADESGAPPVPESVPSSNPTVVEATIAGIQAEIVTGATTCESVVRAYLERIEAYDQSTGVNAISVINERALARAADIDARILAGDELGSLFCVPLLVKDNYDTADLPTTGGSVLLADSLPPDDAFVVRRLREADAIVLAKTNMAEWAFSPRQTVSSTHGRTANAYALDRTPAGSSGGTASAVAASFGVAGLGSDTGNSIRGPSSHLALFGIRSTLGLVSRDGVIPLVFDRDVVGPMTRTVEDAARILNVMAGSDPADPYTEQADARRDADYTERLQADDLSGVRIGVLRALADPAETDPEISALFESALRDLEEAGAEIVDPIVVPGFAGHLQADNFCNRFRWDMRNYLESLGSGAPLLDVRELVGTGRYAAETADSLEFFTSGPFEGPPALWSPSCPEYAHHPGRQAFHADVVGAMDSADVQVLAYPSWTHPPALLERAEEDYRGDNSQRVAPATGLPTATVPMGFSRGETLPAGLQLLARRWDDGLLLQIAYSYEQHTAHRRSPPGFSSLQPSLQ